MNKNTQISKLNAERNILFIFSTFFAALMISAWLFSMDLRKTIITKNAAANTNAQALIDAQYLRNLSDQEISDSLTFFLMGSSNLFDNLKKEKLVLSESLSRFQKTYALPQIEEIIKRIDTIRLQHQDFFDQAMAFRAKQTESKIVGQFYRAKTAPLRASINKALDEISTVYNLELEKAQSLAQTAAADTEARIPSAMAWFTVLISGLFLGMLLVVLRLIRQRSLHLSERSRLYEAAKKSALTRDGILSAVTQDLSEPLAAIKDATEALKTAPDVNTFNQGITVIDTTVTLIADRIKDILDETKAETDNLTLRVEQIGLEGILDDVHLMVSPLAKQKDIRLEFNPVNPPVLAFIDRERVIRVLSHLVVNAIKFSPRLSKVIVKVRSDQQFIYVSVKDEGSGIPEKHMARIFDHYWQATKTADQGPGIGLAAVKSIVEAHNGIVTAESHQGHGSTFTFSLPRRRPATALLRKPAPAAIKYGQPVKMVTSGLEFKN